MRLSKSFEKFNATYKESERYLENHPQLAKSITDHMQAYNGIQDLIPDTLDDMGMGRFFPFSESLYELESSLELCLLGFYRHSFFALRNVLELGVLGLYFDIDRNSGMESRKWHESKTNTPYFKECLKRLFHLDRFQQFDQKHQSCKQVKELYDRLSDYIHSKGVSFSSIGQNQANFNSFNETSLVRYADFLTRIVCHLCTMLLLKYPIGIQDLPLFGKFGLDLPMGFLDASDQGAVMRILPLDVIVTLQDISDHDHAVKSIVESINSMQDLAEDQICAQTAELHAFIEEHSTE